MGGLTSQIDRQLLRETVRAFTLTNDDLGGTPEFTADVQHACNSCQVGHSLGHSPFYSLILLLVHSFIQQLLTHSLIHLFTLSLFCLWNGLKCVELDIKPCSTQLTLSLTHSFIYSLTNSSVPYSFFHLLTHSFTHSLAVSAVPVHDITVRLSVRSSVCLLHCLTSAWCQYCAAWQYLVDDDDNDDSGDVCMCIDNPWWSEPCPRAITVVSYVTGGSSHHFDSISSWCLHQSCRHCWSATTVVFCTVSFLYKPCT